MRLHKKKHILYHHGCMAILCFYNGDLGNLCGIIIITQTCIQNRKGQRSSSFGILSCEQSLGLHFFPEKI